MYAAREKESTGGLKSLPAREKKARPVRARSRFRRFKIVTRCAMKPGRFTRAYALRAVEERRTPRRGLRARNRAKRTQGGLKVSPACTSKRELRCGKPRTRVSGKHARACATFARERESPGTRVEGHAPKEPRRRLSGRTLYVYTKYGSCDYSLHLWCCE